MAYTPYKMKGPSLYKKLSAKQAKYIDTNKDGVISGADFPLKKRKCKKKKGSYAKMLNIRNKSNKPCTGCKSICPSCRGKK